MRKEGLMSSHFNRSAYFVCREGILNDPDLPSSGCPFTGNSASANSRRRSTEPRFKFGRMFPQLKPVAGDEKFHKDIVAELLELATSINSKQDDASHDSDLPAGSTYLGQFIAHEVTFNKTEEPLDSNGTELEFRSPQIDLDSLYGRGPGDRRLYQDGAR